MTTEENVASYKDKISAQAANMVVNQLVNELASVCVERDELKAKVAELTAQLSPKPTE